MNDPQFLVSTSAYGNVLPPQCSLCGGFAHHLEPCGPWKLCCACWLEHYRKQTAECCKPPDAPPPLWTITYCNNTTNDPRTQPQA